MGRRQHFTLQALLRSLELSSKDGKVMEGLHGLICISGLIPLQECGIDTEKPEMEKGEAGVGSGGIQKEEESDTNHENNYREPE